MKEILRIGTSAGGARAKALIAYNETTGEVRSGHTTADEGFSSWLLKFDGVGGNRDKESDDPKGYCAIEYAYYKMASAAGVRMSGCRLLEENGRRHFMTRRFDRTGAGEKLHVQTLLPWRTLITTAREPRHTNKPSASHASLDFPWTRRRSCSDE